MVLVEQPVLALRALGIEPPRGVERDDLERHERLRREPRHPLANRRDAVEDRQQRRLLTHGDDVGLRALELRVDVVARPLIAARLRRHERITTLQPREPRGERLRIVTGLEGDLVAELHDGPRITTHERRLAGRAAVDGCEAQLVRDEFALLVGRVETPQRRQLHRLRVVALNRGGDEIRRRHPRPLRLLTLRPPRLLRPGLLHPARLTPRRTHAIHPSSLDSFGLLTT